LSALANIGELCRFMEFDRIVMALSPKPVILAAHTGMAGSANVAGGL
jgi:hypothetical protein